MPQSLISRTVRKRDCVQKEKYAVTQTLDQPSKSDSIWDEQLKEMYTKVVCSRHKE